MASDAHSAEGAAGTASWDGFPRFPDGWGLVRGIVRLTSGEPVGDCGVVYYPTTPLTAAVSSRGCCTNADGVYNYPLPAGTFTMAANGRVSRVGADGRTVGVPVLGKVTGVVVSPRQITTADVIATERPDLIGKTGNVADLLDIYDFRRHLQ
jgi:hypothetical protein